MGIKEQCKYIIECDGCGRGLGLQWATYSLPVLLLRKHQKLHNVGGSFFGPV